ncbi:MAG TPA: hypothetical protein VIF11_15805 [Methylomirabilota bacterium]|jgi:hypothetical protein
MSTGATVLIAAVALGAGVYIGVQLTKQGVQEGVVGAGDKVIRAIGGDPASGYGHVAHTIIDAFAGEALNG